MFARLLSAAPVQPRPTAHITQYSRTDDDDDDEEEEIPTNFIRTCAIYVDDHMNVFRLVPYVVGAVALGTIAKSIALFRQFRHVSEIPKRFIDNHVQLAGQIRHCHNNGTLDVEHIPIGNLIEALRLTSNPGFLKVRLAGIKLEEVVGVPWIQAECDRRYIWFRMLRVNPENPDTLDCIIQTRNPWFAFKKDCFNAELVREGLATVTPMEEFKDCKDREYLKFMKQLRKAEQPKQNIFVRVLRSPLTLWEYLKNRRQTRESEV
ncbi:protein C3orf33 isoform X2 [Lingula anatina]|uniref:Protein C3orf33 isoform X2 n=1 Tax=Lingula anatina TaxID=7574 RepID=A0A1S3JB30_LINAN|nr:protein C3orf33 isoform X2 [Lingula anatina]|eukprot:XP_013407401.1 protein C3orf33 isoform X2 [Lingula anatina]